MCAYISLGAKGEIPRRQDSHVPVPWNCGGVNQMTQRFF